MRCPQCQFENIPGQERCLRCGAVLQAGVVVGPVNPPRMARWKRPIRAALRWLRLRRALPEAPAIPRVQVLVPAFLKIMSADAFLGLILSIIPGLAHYVDGQFREIRWFVLGWLLALLAGIFFYGGGLGFLLLGLAVGLHGWIAVHYAQSKEQTDPLEKIRTVATVLVVFAFLYWGVRAVAFRGFVFGLSNLAIPNQNVQVGDVLLARRSRAHVDKLPRGSLILGNFHRLYGNQVTRDTYEMMGQVIALPGEKIEIIEGRFVVNGQELDVDKFPVPGWLSKERLSATIPTGSYFVSAVYQFYGHGMQLTSDAIRDVCVLKKGDIEAKAVMRWFPLAKRGFLRADQ